MSREQNLCSGRISTKAYLMPLGLAETAMCQLSRMAILASLTALQTPTFNSDF
jgi:hypothetical protein